MLQIDIANTAEKFRSHLRVTQMPNRILKPGIAKKEGDPIHAEEMVDVIEWRWHATTNATDQPTRSESGTAENFAAALTAGKAEMARQYQAASIPAAELAHLDHVE